MLILSDINVRQQSSPSFKKKVKIVSAQDQQTQSVDMTRQCSQEDGTKQAETIKTSSLMTTHHQGC